MKSTITEHTVPAKPGYFELDLPRRARGGAAGFGFNSETQFPGGFEVLELVTNEPGKATLLIEVESQPVATYTVTFLVVPVGELMPDRDIENGVYLGSFHDGNRRLCVYGPRK